MVFKGRAEGAVCSTKSRARAARGAFFRKKGPARGSGRFVAPFRPFFGTPDPHDSMVFTYDSAHPDFFDTMFFQSFASRFTLIFFGIFVQTLLKNQ